MWRNSLVLPPRNLLSRGVVRVLLHLDVRREWSGERKVDWWTLATAGLGVEEDPKCEAAWTGRVHSCDGRACRLRP